MDDQPRLLSEQSDDYQQSGSDAVSPTQTIDLNTSVDESDRKGFHYPTLATGLVIAIALCIGMFAWVMSRPNTVRLSEVAFDTNEAPSRSGGTDASGLAAGQFDASSGPTRQDDQVGIPVLDSQGQMVQTGSLIEMINELAAGGELVETSIKSENAPASPRATEVPSEPDTPTTELAMPVPTASGETEPTNVVTTRRRTTTTMASATTQSEITAATVTTTPPTTNETTTTREQTTTTTLPTTTTTDATETTVDTTVTTSGPTTTVETPICGSNASSRDLMVSPRLNQRCELGSEIKLEAGRAGEDYVYQWRLIQGTTTYVLPPTDNQETLVDPESQGFGAGSLRINLVITSQTDGQTSPVGTRNKSIRLVEPSSPDDQTNEQP